MKNSKIPIVAYLIDEHVYYRCPTVLVCTADKIARLSFVPKAGTIFGNVDKFNKYYGGKTKFLEDETEIYIYNRKDIDELVLLINSSINKYIYYRHD